MTNSKTQFKSIKHQGGWTFWSMAFTLSVLMFFAYVGMQLVPVYSANQNIQNAIFRSVEGSDLRKVSRAEVIKRINQQLYLDGSHKILDYKNDLKITRSRNSFLVQAKYERKVPLFFNISVAVDFSPKAQCDLNGRCTS
ncbi:DUF4845 domain-containing protein [Arenicella xantha]|uniref:Uncharacterized protein DUF4845 n=1 Tax=Arenicella xantha TaxID=644221 RepID=A0A395JJP4_9GAMM|nr:DUF4845 domain-containing protein [Arenicella xantha]RBP49271.1 uncharacterized protein DUF4845 [Arenicella xantha]